MRIQRLVALTAVGILFLLVFSRAAPPSVVAATYYVKQSVLEGTEYEHAIFEVDFNQDIYYPDHWPCGCISSTAADCPTSKVRPAVNESGFTIQDLSSTPDTWVNINTSYTQQKYFKFRLDPANFEGCPSVGIVIQNIVGETELLVSNDAIPSSASSQYNKVPWHRDSLWVCPTDPDWRWGWWYFSTVNRPPVTLQNNYRVKWVTLSAPSCGTLPAPPPAGDGTWDLLEESRPLVAGVTLNEYHTARFYAQTRCTNFSVQVRNENITAACDFDIYASLTEANPTINAFTWASHIDGDDSITLLNICNPAGTNGPWPIYIGYHNWATTASCLSRVVATAEQVGRLMPWVDEAPGQVPKIALSGYEIVCGQETFKCSYPSFAKCTYPPVFDCCSTLSALPPFDDPFPLLFPDPNIPSQDFIRSLPWTAYPDQGQNIPKRFTLNLLMSVKDNNNITTLVHTNPNNCVLKWKNVFSNARGEPMVNDIPFKIQNKKTCDPVAMAALETDVEADILAMGQIDDYQQLRLQNFGIIEKMSSTLVWACRRKVESFFFLSNFEATYSNQSSCTQIFESTGFYNDACCDPLQAYFGCCNSQDAELVTREPDIISTTLLGMTCREPVCAERTLVTYQEGNDAQGIKPGEGCTAPWYESASPTAFTAKSQFIADCRTALLGSSSDLLGVPCKNNSDCQYGAQCNPTTLKCNHTEQNVIQCFTERIDPVVAQSLFNFWGIPEQVNATSLATQMANRWIFGGCRGVQSILFKSHWWLGPEIETCVDACTPVAPRCFEIEGCAYDPNVCFISGSAEVCWRKWFEVIPATGCQNEQTCNWMPCGTSSLAECTANCSVGTPVCLDCTGIHCTNVTGFDQARCEQGRCSADDTITDPAACATSGSCSLPCPGCTQAQCEALGSCSVTPLNTFLASIGQTSCCFLPFQVDRFGLLHCDNNYDLTNPYGCNDTAINQAACDAQEGLYLSVVTPTNDKPTCDAVATPRCYATGKKAFTSQNEITCQCSGNDWTELFPWVPATWTPGYFYDLTWTTAAMVPLRTSQPTIDYFVVHAQVQTAITAEASVAFVNDAFCRYSPLLSAAARIACDCPNNSTATCYGTDSTAAYIQSGRGCPFVDSQVKVGLIELDVSDDSFPPDEFCQVITVSFSDIAQFRQRADNSLKAEVFRKKAPNEYSVIKNGYEIAIGQILTDGITIHWDDDVQLDNDLVLCIPLHDNVPIYYGYTVYGLAEDVDGTIRPLVIGTYNNVTGVICGNISGPGIFFGAVFAPDYLTFQGDNVSVLAQRIVACVFYGLICLIALLQIFRIFQITIHHKKKTKVTFCVVIFVFALCRLLFFALLGEGITSPSYTEALFEFPTFLFLCVYTTVLYLWVEIILLSSTLGHLPPWFKRHHILIIWLIWLMFILLAFIAFIIAIHVVNSEDILSCETNSVPPPSAEAISINVAYASFITAVCIFLAILFLLMGGIVLTPHFVKMWQERADPSYHTHPLILRFIKMTCIMVVTFVAMFVIKSGLILASVTSPGSFVIPIVVFAALEFIPSIVALYYIHPPSNKVFVGGSADDSMQS